MEESTFILSNPRLERVRTSLICPACRGELVFAGTGAKCTECAAAYPLRGGKLFFLPLSGDSVDLMDQIKERMKRKLGKWYYRIGVDLLSPNYPFDYAAAVRKVLDPARQLVIDVGAGNNRVDEHILCLDMFDYGAVDIVCDVANLPFRDASIDGCVSRSMLEHVPMPERVVAEFYRVTRQGGTGVHLIPFMMPFHASPYDFQRYTHKGAALLFEGWKLLEQYAPTGPFSLLTNIVVEFVSIALSFGNGRVKAILYFLSCLLFFPLKFLDAPFVRRPAFLTLAPSILSVVRKPIDAFEATAKN